MADWEEGDEEKCYCSVGSKVVGFLASQKVRNVDYLSYSYWLLNDWILFLHYLMNFQRETNIYLEKISQNYENVRVRVCNLRDYS